MHLFIVCGPFLVFYFNMLLTVLPLIAVLSLSSVIFFSQFKMSMPEKCQGAIYYHDTSSNCTGQNGDID